MRNNFFLAVSSICLCLIFFETLYRFGVVEFIDSFKFSETSLIKAETRAQAGLYDLNGKKRKVNSTCLGEGRAHDISKDIIIQQRKNSIDAQRILILGDSYTLGHGIAEDKDKYPFIFRSEVAETPKRDVMLLAECGLTAWQEWNLLNEKGKYYEPDILIIGYVLNDILPKHPTRRRPLGSVEVQQLIYEQLLKTDPVIQALSYVREWDSPIKIFSGLADRYIKQRVLSDYPHFLYRDEGAMKVLTQSYDKISSYALNNGIPLYIILFPNLPKSSSWEVYQQLDLLGSIRDMLEKRGARVINMMNIFKQYEPQGLRFTDDAHPNELAHKLTADALLSRLKLDKVLKTQ